MSETIKVSVDLPAAPPRVYEAWLDSQAHGDFSGGKAEIDPVVGGSFSAWDGYIWGQTLALEPYRRILQSWHTSDFPAGAPDSLLEVLFEPAGTGTRLTLNHSNIPDGQGAEYETGWDESYFQPMLIYFGS